VSASKAKGTAAETAVVRYLQNWWPAAERRALSGALDKGDVAGIANLVVEVKAAAQQRITEWQRETKTEMHNAGASACMLVVKRPYKSPRQWDAYLPAGKVPGFRKHVAEGDEVDTWLRMDLVAAVALLRQAGY
jgi:hypothetical protein